MSKLRKLPSKHQCEQDLGYDGNGDYRGFCADPAVIRCNTCGRYFCTECWHDHLEMTVIAQKRHNKGKLKVYGGNLFALGQQVRVVMAAKSINQVAYRIGETYYTVSRMWGVTGNKKEIAEAEKHPGDPIVVSCLSRNEKGNSIMDFQDVINRICHPKTYTRP